MITNKFILAAHRAGNDNFSMSYLSYQISCIPTLRDKELAGVPSTYWFYRLTKGLVMGSSIYAYDIKNKR